MITDVPGVQVGHWTEDAARTGCTVVVLPEGTVASGEIRGGAPAERETALLEPSRLVGQLDALVLTGGSAFGLAAADGVVRWCEERGRGVPTAGGPVPIVVALGLFDLDVGDGSVRPGPDEGLAACRAAGSGPVELGPVGAGAGARVDRVAEAAGTGTSRPGGLTSVTLGSGDLVVSSLVAVNALGAPGGADDDAAQLAARLQEQPPPVGSTTIGLVATNARLDKLGCFLVAQSAHDGLARGLFPSHTRFDGDALVAASTGTVDAGIDGVRALATAAVHQAVASLAPPDA